MPSAAPPRLQIESIKSGKEDLPGVRAVRAGAWAARWMGALAEAGGGPSGAPGGEGRVPEIAGLEWW